MAAPKKRLGSATGKQQVPRRRRLVNLAPLDPELIRRLPPSMTAPASQMAATMQIEPSQENVDMVSAISGCTQEQARRYLRVKRNDLDAATNAAIDKEDISKLEQGQTWDETAWAADREGHAHQSLAPLGASNAPSRRPSPAPSLGLTQPNNQADADADLAKALAMSTNGGDSGGGELMSFQQETGIRTQDGKEQTFGPATKAHYDEQQWGLTLAQEVVPDVPAREQKHVEFEPRILKHLPSGDYLPNLLSICHAIPKARTALLMPDLAKEDYGFNPDWWRGQPIAMPRIVHTIDGRPADPNADKYDEFVTEIQRIMAFLDSSDRSYATIGALNQTELIRDTDLSSRSGSLLELFLEKWIVAASSKFDGPEAKEQVAGIFNTIVGTTADEGMQTPNLTVIDMKFAKTAEGQRIDLIEMMDNLLWDTSDDSNMSDNYIERPADILVMQLGQANSSATDLGIEVPSEFHLDKYLKEHVAASRATRQKMAQGRKRVTKIEEIEKKLKTWQHPTKSTQIDAGQLLKHTLGHFSGQNRRDADKADTTNNASLVAHETPGHAEIAAKLEAIIASVDEKLKVLAEEKEKTRKAISDMSKAPLPGVQELKHRYTLRGVSTKPNITYILERRDPADTSPQPDSDTAPEGWEWWRVQYEVSGQNAKIMTTRMGDYDVVRAVELEHTSALLVYASDEASDPDFDVAALPVGLKNFIAKENLQLQEEMTAEVEAAPPSYDLTNYDIPRTSIERRDSMDSMKNMGSYSPTNDGGLPDYMDEDSARQHSAYGLGYDVKSGQPYDEPVHEIHLDDSPPDLLSGVSASTREVEMIETAHTPLIPKPATDGSDVHMGGVESQVMGVGGASHVEDTEMK